jgi:hypothetical protein
MCLISKNSTNRREIASPVFRYISLLPVPTFQLMLESLISVHEEGQWVADLDVLKSMDNSLLLRPYQKGSPHHHISKVNARKLSQTLVSIQNWAEFLEQSHRNSIVHAHNNWQARLALASVSIAQQQTTLVFPNDICWECVYGYLGTKIATEKDSACTIIC